MLSTSPLEELATGLDTLGLHHAILPAGSDGALLLLPDYGRVLGLFPLARAGNALWVNPDFLRRLAIGAKDDRWLNPGGDRIWLAPREEFIPEGGDVPAALDPGQFSGRGDRSGYVMENRGEARAWRSELSVRFRIVRRIQPADEPRLQKAWGQSWLRRAGYEEETQLIVSGPFPRRGLWLAGSIHVPSRAQARIPLRRFWADTPFSQLPPGEVGLEDACLVLGRDAGGPRSMGVNAGDCAPRFLCVVPAEPGHSQLVVREFDAAGTEQRDGSLIECRWGGRDGSMEITCTSPALRPGGRLAWRTSTCVFSGRTEEIHALAARIAGGGAASPS